MCLFVFYAHHFTSAAYNVNTKVYLFIDLSSITTVLNHRSIIYMYYLTGHATL